MLKRFKNHLRHGNGRVRMTVKLHSDEELWQMEVVAADSSGLVVRRPDGLEECYPWQMVETVILPSSAEKATDPSDEISRAVRKHNVKRATVTGLAAAALLLESKPMNLSGLF